MLVNLVRMTWLSETLGVCVSTLYTHAKAAGLEPRALPVAGRSDRNCPRYVSLDQAVALIDLMLPRVLDRKANARARDRLGRKARELKDSTRNLIHEQADAS